MGSMKKNTSVTAVCSEQAQVYTVTLTLVNFVLGGVSKVPVTDLLLHACVGEN